MRDFADYPLLIPAMLVAITFHEFAHARVALAFGDHTAEEQGRVTLNPIAHLDPVGTVGILIGTFGWGRPVPVNPRAFRHPKADFFVSAAGPATNLFLAALGGLVLRLVPPAWFQGMAGHWALLALGWLVFLNLSLGLFNLLPLFPLDGSHMLGNLLPVEQGLTFKRFSDAYGMPILMAIIFLGAMRPELSPLRWILWPPLFFLLQLLVPPFYHARLYTSLFG